MRAILLIRRADARAAVTVVPVAGLADHPLSGVSRSWAARDTSGGQDLEVDLAVVDDVVAVVAPQTARCFLYMLLAHQHAAPIARQPSTNPNASLVVNGP